MHRPTLRQLEYLVAVAEQGHIGRAARACGVSQPGLSSQLRALEEELGAPLFERSRRGVRPTRAGARALVHARTALRAADDLAIAVREAAEPLAGPLQLGVIPTVAPYVLPRWLPGVRERWPGLRLLLREDQTTRIVASLREGALDLVLLALPLDEDGVEELAIAREPFLLLVPADHRLATRRRVGEADLRGETVLLLEDGHCLRDQALSFCRAAGARESDAVRATSLTTLALMVAGGLGVTLLPESAVPALAEDRPGVAVVPFRPPEPHRVLGLAWRTESPRAEAFRELAESLRECLEPRVPGRGRGRYGPASRARENRPA